MNKVSYFKLFSYLCSVKLKEYEKQTVLEWSSVVSFGCLSDGRNCRWRCCCCGVVAATYIRGDGDLALLLWKYEQWQSLAIAVCFVVLGWLLMERQKASLVVDWPGNEVCYEAVVISEPVEKPKTMVVDVLLAESGRKLK